MVNIIFGLEMHVDMHIFHVDKKYVMLTYNNNMLTYIVTCQHVK